MREFREELDAELCNVRLLKVVENVFRLENMTGHEIVFVFEAEFEDASLYQRSDLEIVERAHKFLAKFPGCNLNVCGRPRRRRWGFPPE